jgi:signal transduction histidine kinase
MALVHTSAPSNAWLNHLDHRRWRMLTATRVFVLAAALGLSASTGTVVEAATPFLALCVISAVMSIPLPFSSLRAWSSLAEGAIAALVLVAGQGTDGLLVYLVVPPLAAGVAAGRAYGLFTVATEVAAVAGALLAGDSIARAGAVATDLAPWLLIAVGTALLGSWIREATPAETADQAGYESAHRLLAQLRTVSRRLSSGLDTHSLAQQTLERVVRELSAPRAVLLVKNEGQGCLALSTHGTVPFADEPEQDPTVLRCWSLRAPAQTRIPSGTAQTRSRLAFVLQVGPRLLGTLVVDRAEPVDADQAERTQRFLDEQTLKLESALLFEEVRSLATMEERHRLAREIHDGIAQEVASLGYLVDGLAGCTDPGEVQDVYRELRRELSRIVGELRLSIFDLRSGNTSRAGLGRAIAEYAREVGGRSGIAVHLALSEHPRRLAAEVESHLFRIAQEAITNARKHAQAANLWVSLNIDTSVADLVVEDDGVGTMTPRPEHFGLAIMRERAEAVGAVLALGLRPGGGSRVSVSLERDNPITQGAQGAHLSSARRRP